MALVGPAWLDGSFVQKTLQNAEKDESVQVSGITVKRATAVGDNYGSDMYRVAVEFSRDRDGHEIQEKKSVIVKAAPIGDIRQELVEDFGSFDTELPMMSETLPKMNEILEQFGFTSLSARCFSIQYEKPIYIVCEDLISAGFRMANRQAGLDLDHSLLAIKNLGRFHAVSIALKEKDPKAFTNYKKGVFNKDKSRMMQSYFHSSIKAFTDEAVSWPELSPRIKEKLSKLSEVLFEKTCETALYQEDDFNVLNHGDFWVNNMLFRYDEEQRPIDHIFVDFQGCNYGSPALDILYFLGTSPNVEVQLHHRELLLHEYQASLNSTMIKLKCKTEALNFDKLQETLKQRALCEVISAITVLPIVVLEKGVEVQLDDLLNKDGDFNNAGQRGKTYRKIMTRLLPWYESNGFLDV